MPANWKEIASKIWGIWLDGGEAMIPLALLAAVLYASGFYLLLYLRRSNIRIDGEDALREAIRDPENASGRAGEIIRFTQANAKSAKQIRNRFDEVRTALIAGIQRRLTFLNTLVAAAPLLGLLGTVMGMLSTFDAISRGGGSETASMVADGISEALITTQTGLLVALPGLFLTLLIRRQKHAIEAALARIESLTLALRGASDEE